MAQSKALQLVEKSSTFEVVLEHHVQLCCTPLMEVITKSGFIVRKNLQLLVKAIMGLSLIVKGDSILDARSKCIPKDISKLINVLFWRLMTLKIGQISDPKTNEQEMKQSLTTVI